MDLFFIAIAIFLIIAGLYWWRMRRLEAEIAEGAEFEWKRLGEADPELLKGLDEARFKAIYKHVHYPRFPGYALACLGCFIASLPLTFGVLAGAGMIAARFGLTPANADIANRYLIDDGRLRFIHSAAPEAALYLVRDFGGFYYFFGVLFVWLLIVAFFMRRYHARRPGYLRDEILRAR